MVNFNSSCEAVGATDVLASETVLVSVLCGLSQGRRQGGINVLNSAADLSGRLQAWNSNVSP